MYDDITEEELARMPEKTRKRIEEYKRQQQADIEEADAYRKRQEEGEDSLGSVKVKL